MANNLSESDECARPNSPAPIIVEDASGEGWSARTLGNESPFEGATEIAKRLRRGDETFGDPNTRDFPSVSHDEEAARIRKDPDTRLDSRADLIGRARIDTLNSAKVRSTP